MKKIVIFDQYIRGVREWFSAFPFLSIPISFNPIPMLVKHLYSFHSHYFPFLGTNLIHDFTAVTFSVKLAFFRKKNAQFREICEICDFS